MIIHEAEHSYKNDYLYHQFDEGLNFQKHTHYSYEIVFSLDGKLHCEVGNKKYILSSGMGLLIPPGHIHSYFTPKNSKSYLCIFSTDLVSSFYKKTKSYNFSDLVFRFNDETDIKVLSDDETNIYLKQAVLYKFCGQIFKQSDLLFIDPSYFMLTNSLSMYIQNNFTQNIKLKSIAKEFGYDYSYLSDFFNHNFSMDFPSYVNKFRIQHATNLLESSNDDITNVAMKSGFSTIRNFNRVFKEEMNVTPREYKKIHLAKNSVDCKQVFSIK